MFRDNWSTILGNCYSSHDEKSCDLIDDNLQDNQTTDMANVINVEMIRIEGRSSKRSCTSTVLKMLLADNEVNNGTRIANWKHLSWGWPSATHNVSLSFKHEVEEIPMSNLIQRLDSGCKVTLDALPKCIIHVGFCKIIGGNVLKTFYFAARPSILQLPPQL